MSQKSSLTWLVIFLLMLQIVLLNSSQLKTNQYPSFESYTKIFNKTYSPQQYSQCQSYYKKNIAYLTGLECESCGVNNFTDWSYDEMKLLRGSNLATGLKSVSSNGIQVESSEGAFSVSTSIGPNPLSFDWRQFNAVTSVKNQQKCGSCWAFATTAFFQSNLIINQNYTNDIDLSEQFLLGCDQKSNGCNGGKPDTAMNKILTYGGIPSESQYPYDYYQNQSIAMCFQSNITKLSGDQSLVQYSSLDKSSIQSLLLTKPLLITICSSDLTFYSPTPTHRTLQCSTLNNKPDHMVLLVGYTQTEWIIKNQWGRGWGLDGYLYVSKDKGKDCCVGGYIGTTTKYNTKCQPLCKYCDNNDRCVKCTSGYGLRIINNQTTCQKCIAKNCLQCKDYWAGQACQVCAQGYSVMPPSYQCQKSTINNCAFIENRTCLECSIGYVKNQDLKCINKNQATNDTVKIAFNKQQQINALVVQEQSSSVLPLAVGGGCGLVVFILLAYGGFRLCKSCKNKQEQKSALKNKIQALNDQSPQVMVRTKTQISQVGTTNASEKQIDVEI